MLGSSPEVHRLAQEAAQEVGPNDFFEAELENPLDALEHYCGSHLAFQRLAYAQGIAAAAAGAQYQDCVDVLLPLVERLARDGESEIRGAAVQQIQGLGKALHAKDCERSLRDIEASLLVCAQQCALDDDDEVSQAAVAAFQQLVLLLPAARATAASKRAVDRLEQRGTDDGMVVAVRLLAHTVQCWTPEALRRHVPRYINRWANHRDFSVREALSSCMSLVLKATPLQLCHQLLLPFFYQLCRDSNWRVRRACAADLPRLAASLQERGQGAAGAAAAAEGGGPYGQCCSQSSSCLRDIRFSSEQGSLSSGNLLAAGGGAPGLHVRNRSSGSLGAPARTTAEIMTKHPMHSSLIVDSALAAAASPSSSAPPSPTSQQQHPLSAGGGQQQQEQQQQEQQAQQERQQQEWQQQEQQQREEQPEQEQAPSCALEAAAPLLHDCWCALRQCMELLTADSSHWVKVAALSGLGPFLLVLPRCQLGQLLLGRFTGMAGSTVVIYEISVALACAQHFGGVAVRLGSERWPDMRDAWHALQASRDPAVLCELVRCLAGLVQALGPAITVQELLPALASLLQSHLTWVSGQLVAAFSDLLELLPPSSQEMVLKVLEQLVSSSGERSKAWRLRRDLALQLGRMAAAVGPDAIVDSLWPAAMALCCDPVAAVRSAAAGQVGMLLAALPASMLCPREQPGSPAGADVQSASGHEGAVSAASGSSSSSSTSCASSSSSAASSSAGSSAGSDVGSACGADLDASVGGSGTPDDSEDTHGDQGGAPGGLPNGVAPPHGSPAAGAKSSRRGVDRAVAAGAGKVVTYGVRFQDAFDDGGDGLACRGYAGSCAAAGGSGGRSSLDLELDLPSALAPAPAGFAPCGAQGEEEQEAAAGASGGLGGTAALLLPAGGGSADATSASSESEADGSSDYACASDSDDTEGPGPGGAMPPAKHVPTPPPPPPQRQPPQPVPVPGRSPAAAIHPAMMPVGHPAMAAVGTLQPSPQPAGRRLNGSTAPKAKSAGDLLKVEAASAGDAPAHAPPRRRHSSNSIPGRTMTPPFALSSSSSGAGNVDRGFDASLPEPGIAAPHQYVACLANSFGCSANHQQRQLYVPLVMGVLAACHDRLSCAQAAQLLDRLEVLAADSVPGVRYAVAAAVQHLRHTAVQLRHGEKQPQPQPQQQQQQQQQPLTPTPPQTPQQQQQQQQPAAAPPEANGVHDSYHDYVMQLAERSHSGSLPAATETPAPAELAGSASKPPLAPSSGRSGPASASGAQQPQQQVPRADGAVLRPLSLPEQQQQQQHHHHHHHRHPRHHGHQRGHMQGGEQRHDACCEMCGVSVDVSPDAPTGLEWLVKLSSCQLERLIGVVALTTGPL